MDKTHPLSIKSLIDVKFQKEDGNDKNKNVCPACLKTLTNASKLSGKIQSWKSKTTTALTFPPPPLFFIKCCDSVDMYFVIIVSICLYLNPKNAMCVKSRQSQRTSLIWVLRELGLLVQVRKQLQRNSIWLFNNYNNNKKELLYLHTIENLFCCTMMTFYATNRSAGSTDSALPAYIYQLSPWMGPFCLPESGSSWI